MPRTPEEMEADLEELQEEMARLRRSLRRGRAFTDNPLALATDLDDLGSVKTYLTIEKPNQVPGTPPADVYYLYGYRTRQMQMTTTKLIDHMVRWPDAATNNCCFGVRMPTDWVVGTDVALKVVTRPRANGKAVMRSYITAWAVGEEETSYNIENAANVDITGTANVLAMISRTITGTDLQASDVINWSVERQGGGAADTMAGNLDGFYGACLEYTAWF